MNEHAPWALVSLVATTRARRPLRFLLTLVFAGVALGLVLRTETFRAWSTTLAEQQLSALLGEEVALGELRIELLPLRVTAVDVAIRDAQTGEHHVLLDRGRARLGLRLSGLRVLLLELDRPTVDLRWVDGQLQAFPGLAGGEDEPFEPPQNLPWDELIVRDADVDLRWASADAARQPFTLRVRGLDVRPALAWPDADIDLDELALGFAGQEQVATQVRLPGVQLQADRLHVPDLRVDFPMLALEGRLGAELGGPLGGVLSLHARLPELGPLLPPSLSLEGAADIDLELGGTVEAPTFTVAVLSEPVLLEQLPSLARPLRYDFGRVQAQARGDLDGLTLERLRVGWAQGTVEAEGLLGWDGVVHHAAVRGEDLDFATALIQVGDFTGPWVGFLADLEAQVSGTLSPLSLQGPFELDALDLRVADGTAANPRSTTILDVPTARLAGALDLGPQGIRLDARELVAGDTRGRVDAWLGWGARPGMDLDLDLSAADLTTFAPLYDVGLEGRGRVQARIWGPYHAPRIEGRVDVQDFWCLGVPFADHFTAEVRTDNLIDLDFLDFAALRGRTLTRGNLRLGFREQLTLETDALIADGRVEDLLGMFLDPTGVSGQLDATFALSGPVEALDGEVQASLRQVELYGERFSQGQGHGRMTQGRFTLDELLLWRAGGAESLFARGSVGAGWALNAELRSDGLRVETLNTMPPDSTLKGRVRLDATLGGTLLEPEPAGRLALRELRLEGSFLSDADVHFQTEAGRLRAQAALADGTARAELELGLYGAQDYALRYTLKDLPLERLYPLTVEGRVVRLRLTGAGGLEGAFGDERPQVFTLTASSSELSWGPRRLRNAEPWTLWVEDGGLRTEGLRLVGQGTDLTVTALRGPQGGLLLLGGGPFDLGWVQVFTQDTVRADGAGTLQFALSGDLDTLGGQAEVTMRGATLRTAAFPHPFEQVDAHIVGGPDGYRVAHGQGVVGGGEVELSGVVHAERWWPTHYDLHAELRDARVRYVEDLPPMAADASLDLDGRPEALLLSGDVRIKDMVFAERIDWEQWAVDFRSSYLTNIVEPEADQDALFDLDLRVVADGTATVRNNIADGVLSADLRVVGSSARPGLIGDVRMQPGGTLTYEDREFTVTRAELHYIDPWTWDPELDFVLETDIRTDDGSYHVIYPVSGPFSDWRADPRSDPPLSQGDINALILFGVTREEIENLGGSSPIALEGLDLLLTGESQRALERLGDGVFATTSVELVTGVSARGSVISSEWRVQVQQDVTQPVEFTFIGEINPFRLNDQYLALEKRLAGNMYLGVFWSSFQRERNLSIGGAYGVDFKVRWDLD